MQVVLYELVTCECAVAALWFFPEVFILIGLREACFVSAATAGVTDTHLAQNGEIRENRVDSIGVTKWCVGFRGSADSKGLTGWHTSGIALWLEKMRRAANMNEGTADVIVCQ